MSALEWVLCVLASARTWRLASIDAIGFGFRNLVYRGPNWIQEALICPFCLGAWIGLGYVLTGLAWSDSWVWQATAGWMAVSWCSGQLNAWLDIRPVHDGGGEIAAVEEAEDLG